ncbi:HIT family protein [Curtobacterium citri]|uniref:HIT family protein n=1 Tax=Curtobacterium citri TaxID=3055139 RepID=UPI00333FF112
MKIEFGCPFCDIAQQRDPDAREVYRDENFVAFFPTEPAVLGHTLIIPRSHVDTVWNLDESTAERLGIATVRLSRAVRDATMAPGLNVIQSNGEVATQTVMHLHVHLVPRWPNDPLGRIWPKETDYSERQKDVAWEEVRDNVIRVLGKLNP